MRLGYLQQDFVLGVWLAHDHRRLTSCRVLAMSWRSNKLALVDYYFCTLCVLLYFLMRGFASVDGPRCEKLFFCVSCATRPAVVVELTPTN